jgi:hypothetical protein
MFIPHHVPLDWIYTATASGAVLKTVRCESCQAEYVYRLERTCTGSGTSRVLFFDKAGATERALAAAQKELRRSLRDGFDVVPCPTCGWYQQYMVHQARRQRFDWMLLLGVLLTAGLLPLGMLGLLINSGASPPRPPVIPWDAMLAGFVLLALVGTTLLVARPILAGRYDPNNDDLVERLQRGRSRAVLRAEFNRCAWRPPA